MIQSNLNNQQTSSERSRSMIFIVVLLLLASMVACNLGATPEPTTTYTPLPSATATSIQTSTQTPVPTNTPTPTASATPSRTPPPSATFTPMLTDMPLVITGEVTCPDAPQSMLETDAWAMVSLDPPLPLRMRSQPGFSGEFVGQALPGEKVLVLEGPSCADGYAWWLIQRLDGLKGWSAEGNLEGYWLIPLQPLAGEWRTTENTITLTAGQIDSADDIEAAIIKVTAGNTRPGIVILDGSNGSFVFTGDDRSLNIFVSNLTLQGEFQATIENCDDGLFFDNFPLENILVEGIEFYCKGHGIVAGGEFKNVIINNNIFNAKLSGIEIGGASSDWSFTDNLIETEGNGFNISGATGFVIANNNVTGTIGISLANCSNLHVRENYIQASHRGIMLQRSSENTIEQNMILGIGQSGIALESGSTGNAILSNRVSCAENVLCLTLYVDPKLGELNTFEDNLP
jgi:parallel beta-helix repeat protein